VHRQVPVRPAVDASYLTRGGVQAALAWLRLNRARIGLAESKWGELARRVAELALARFAGEEEAVSRRDVDDVLTRARQSLCSGPLTDGP